MKKILAILALLSIGCRAHAFPAIGYVQITTGAVQTGGFNTQTGTVGTLTAGTVTDTGLSVGGCVQAGIGGQLTVSGANCVTSGGQVGAGTINQANQDSIGFYTGVSTTIIGGLVPGTSGQVLTTAGAGVFPFWSSVLTQSSATVTYLQSSSATATYLSILNATTTYLPLTGGSLSGNLSSPQLDSVAGLYQSGFRTFFADQTDIIGNVWAGFNAGANAGANSSDTGFGSDALKANINGARNTAVGNLAISQNTTGSNLTAIGLQALTSNISGGDNSAGGYQSLENATGSNNSAWGSTALLGTTSGIDNSGFGFNACGVNTIGNNNSCFGFGANLSAANLTNATAIGYRATVSSSNTIQLGGSGANSTVVSMSSAALTGYLQLEPQSLAQLQAIATSANQLFVCSNCTFDVVCVSTGSINSFVRVSSRTVACQ